jgi:Flp pilus assembly protein TadG
MGQDFLRRMKEEQGLTAVIVALLMVVFLGVAAFAIDIGHLHLVKNELQNAADAGCLAGARVLYDESGEYVNGNASQIAFEAAIANQSENLPAEVHWTGGNTGDVLRGHWSFSARTFTPSDNYDYTSVWDVSPEELDANPNFVNAVQVKTRRQNSPAVSFFARIFGYENFFLSAEAVAYIGFAGTLGPGEVGEPVAMCKESLWVDGKYSCSVGRMITMGEIVAGEETGGWTDFTQDPLTGGPNPTTVTSLVGAGGDNPDPIFLGQPLAVSGGEIPDAFILLRTRWEADTGRIGPWRMALPVIECPGNNLDSSEIMAGTVRVNILWITGEGDDPSYSDAPWQMAYPHSGEIWSSGDPDGQVRWNSFVQSFNLRKLDGTFVPYQKKTIYFVPDCHHQRPRGRTGGENFGILAKIPVLAK